MNRFVILKTVIIITALAAVVISQIFWRSRSSTLEKSQNGLARDNTYEVGHSISSDKRVKIAERVDSIRTEQLERLKQRWKEIRRGVRTGIITAEYQELAKESIEILMCSNETLKLIKFLEADGMTVGVSLVNDQVSLLFRSPRAAEARAMLVELHEKLEPLTLSYREIWSYDAGRGCSEGELDSFRSALGDKACALNALLGRNLELASSDPQKAIASTLKALAEGISSSMVIVGFQDQIRKLPSDAKFEEIKQSFPVEKGYDELPVSPIHEGRDQLFEQWAMSDPAAASNYVMAHPERMGPETITTIAETVMSSDPLVGLEWVQNFPDGPYFDAAAYGAIPHISDNYLNESLKLASQIENQKLRQLSIELLQAKQRRRKADGIEK